MAAALPVASSCTASTTARSGQPIPRLPDQPQFGHRPSSDPDIPQVLRVLVNRPADLFRYEA
jgi:hypothetical protein